MSHFLQIQGKYYNMFEPFPDRMGQMAHGTLISWKLHTHKRWYVSPVKLSYRESFVGLKCKFDSNFVTTQLYKISVLYH